MEILEIIKGVMKKHKPSEKALFKLLAPMIFKICLRYCKDRAEAEDQLQECMLNIFSKLEKFDHQKGNVEAWAYRLSVNNVLQYLRKTRKHAFLVFVDHLPERAVAENEIAAISEDEIMNHISELPEGYRLILNLYVFDEWSHKQIAEALGISESTSRSQLTRARVLLKKRLHQQNNQRYEKRLA